MTVENINTYGLDNHTPSLAKHFSQVSADTPRSMRGKLRQIRLTHQEAVAFTRGAAAFVERPHDQALAATAVAAGEDALEIG